MSGAAEVAGHPTPVRVLAEPRALRQLAAGDRPRPAVGVVVARPRRPPPPARPWWRPRRRRPSARRGRSRPPRGRAASSTSSTGPARPEASTITVSFVDVQPSLTNRLKLRSTACLERGLERGRLRRGIGREHRQHRGHVRGQHRRALGHAADAERGADDEHLLGHGVGGHDRPGGVGAALGRAGRHQGRHARLHHLDREGDADEARRADQDVVGRAPERRRRRRAHPLGVLHAHRAVGGIGVAAVEHHRGRPPAGAARWARLTCTGPAASLFEVKVAAAATAPASAVATSDRSGSPLALIPAAIPAATNPADP